MDIRKRKKKERYITEQENLGNRRHFKPYPTFHREKLNNIFFKSKWPRKRTVAL